MYVSPGRIGDCVSPATPSINHGARTPCQCPVVGSFRSFTSRMRSVLPASMTMTGPGTMPSYAVPWIATPVPGSQSNAAA